MKLTVLWYGLDCYTARCLEILAHIELPYNLRVNKVFIIIIIKTISCIPLDSSSHNHLFKLVSWMHGFCISIDAYCTGHGKNISIIKSLSYY